LVENPKRNQGEHKNTRHQLVSAAYKGVKDVAAVQLPDRQQVERGGENSHPGGPRDRVQQNVGGPDVREANQLKDSLNERHAKREFVRPGNPGDRLRQSNSDSRPGQQSYTSG